MEVFFLMATGFPTTSENLVAALKKTLYFVDY